MTDGNQSKWTRKFENLRCASCNAATTAYLFIDEDMDFDKQTLFTTRIYCDDCRKK